jgi:hypothetical protein
MAKVMLLSVYQELINLKKDLIIDTNILGKHKRTH